MEEVETKTWLKGGEFIVKESAAKDVFISEEFSEEARMMQQSAADFIAKEITPNLEALDTWKDPEAMPRLLEQSADMGFLGIGVSSDYGGIDTPFNDTLLFLEEISKGHSFTLTIGVQTSIGIAPIQLYGNHEQKSKYLPDLLTAKRKTCYCLTEPGSGSDANSAKTKAVLNKEGTHYILNGQKMWITNAGFADMFIVFAKVEGDENLSAFIVEEAYGGVSKGAEEKKMGIKGSSTRQLFFNNVPVPVENMLGAQGEGFKIAVNVLNTGRIKLGISAIGVGKLALDHAVNYASERIQFKQPIANFGAIQHKLGNMAAKIFATEAAGYRTGHYIDLRYDEMLREGVDSTKAKAKSIEEYAMECAVLKVYGSEAQAYVADEAVQIYGGMGFSAESPVERIYRDSRINRIFEGTNEINRMLLVDQLIRKGMKGKLPLLQAAQGVMKELTAIPGFGDQSDEWMAAEIKALANMKKAALLVIGGAAQKLMKDLRNEQEVLMNGADMLIQTYIFESALLKVMKLKEEHPSDYSSEHDDIVKVLMHEAMDVINRAGRESIYAFAEGDEQRMLLLGLKRFTKLAPTNLKECRRNIAKRVIEKNQYPF